MNPGKGKSVIAILCILPKFGRLFICPFTKGIGTPRETRAPPWCYPRGGTSFVNCAAWNLVASVALGLQFRELAPSWWLFPGKAFKPFSSHGKNFLAKYL